MVFASSCHRFAAPNALASLYCSWSDDPPGLPPLGVCHVAAVLLVAVSTCPLLGAVADDTATTVVALRSPDAVRSSVNRESSPAATVPAVVPTDSTAAPPRPRVVRW